MGRTVVGLGPGDPDVVPVAALAAVRKVSQVWALDVDDALAGTLDGVSVTPIRRLADAPPGAIIVAPDSVALRAARSMPEVETIPDRDRLRQRVIGAAVAELAAVGAHLRRECPWDRVQTAETIVPHTVEEAFEVAEAVGAGDVVRQADEIGDLLFQAVFLAQLLEETDDADLGTIASDHTRKLISRHPHVYGEAVAETAGGVRDLWERQKREGRGGGIFHEMPAGLPALAFATKAQRRAAAVGFEFASAADALEKLSEEVAELHRAPDADELGDVLFACVGVARALKVDPEIAVRAAAARFRDRVEAAAALAEAAGTRFEELEPAEQLSLYARAKGG